MSYVEMKHRSKRPFLKLLYENADKNEKKLDAEIIKTYDLCNKIICRPPQSRETIPLRNTNLKYMFLNYEYRPRTESPPPLSVARMRTL